MNRSTPFAREGYPFIAITSSLTVILVFVAWNYCSAVIFATGFFFFLLTLFILYFFRNPQRVPPAEPGCVVSPADGKVIVSERVPVSPLGGEAYKVSIFMSVLNVHVNRSPVSGVVRDVIYNEGRFFDARKGKTSFENERSCLLIETDCGVMLASVQIAGLLARRIVSYPKAGDRLSIGEIYGMICFGSRLDVYLPADIKPLVKCGDMAVAGETVLFRLS